MPGINMDDEGIEINSSPNSGVTTISTAPPISPTQNMRRLPFTDSPNARSKSITTTDLDTHGILNRHATKNTSYQVGVSEDKGTRRTMEDAHSFVVDFDNVRGQGFFAIFDGHAGKHAAEWCGSNFHQSLLTCLREASPDTSIPDVLNNTYQAVDGQLSRMSEESEGKMHSGCTVVTAFLRIEDANGKQSFLEEASPPTPESPKSYRSKQAIDGDENQDSSTDAIDAGSGDDSSRNSKSGKKEKKSGSNRIKSALKSLSASSITSAISNSTKSSSSPTLSRQSSEDVGPARVPPPSSKRVLYCANAGDARGVLSRKGRAVRLTYDHKGSDKQEAKRITDAGGFVMSGRVNGVLAVTRSLGDSSMKDFVVGAPYTTETELCDEDECLILACDGLWDVINDQAAVDLVRDIEDAQVASQKLLKYALSHHTTDNVTVIVVRFKKPRTSS